MESTAAGSARTQFKYGESVAGVRGLRVFSIEVERDPDVALVEKIRHHGTDYWWRELAFGPTGRSFEALDRSIRAQFHRGGAYYVEGRAKYHAFPVRNDERLELKLLDISERVDVEVSVFMPNTAEFSALTSTASPGVRFAVFSSDTFVMNVDRAAMSIDLATQIMPID